MSMRLVSRRSTLTSNTVVSIFGRPVMVPATVADEAKPQRTSISVTIESMVPVATPTASASASMPHSTGAQ